MKPTVLITGASRGIGEAIALKLSKDYKLILHASQLESLAPLLSKIDNRNRHIVLCSDFSDNASLVDFCKSIKKLKNTSLYGLINNAGITIDKPLIYCPEKDIDKMIQVNLKAPIMVGKTMMKIFLKNNSGVIINMSSIVGEQGNAFQSIYAATKSSMTAMAKSWAKEFAKLNTENRARSLSISPGFIETEMTDRVPGDLRRILVEQIPLKRIGSPEEVANLVEFVLRPSSSYLNGTDLKINGGLA